MLLPTDIDLESLGHAAGQYQHSPHAIRDALDRLRATPRLALNDRVYYRTDDIRAAVAILNAPREISSDA